MSAQITPAKNAANHVLNGSYLVTHGKAGLVVRWIPSGHCMHGHHFVIFADQFVGLIGDVGTLTMTVIVTSNALDWVLKQDPEQPKCWIGNIDHELFDHVLEFDSEAWAEAVEQMDGLSENASRELELFRDLHMGGGDEMARANEVWELLDDHDGNIPPGRFRRVPDDVIFRFALIKLAAEATR